MCDCKDNIEDKLLEIFKQNQPAATNHSIKLMSYTLILGNQLAQLGFMEAEQTANFSLKKGGEKQRKAKINIIFTYCPFCGDKYATETVNEGG